MSAIQTLDARQWALGNGTERRNFAKALREALATSGLSDECVDGIFEWSKRFFALHLGEKQKASNIPGVNQQRGWSSLGEEKTSTLKGREHESHIQLVDAKEHFDCGPAGDEMFPNV
ncbi:hypothetical protein BBP40_006437 [Aspergillus hancockii]|nr:hypothetical protein BBP40_006437 [Aspergillus hancockii]